MTDWSIAPIRKMTCSAEDYVHQILPLRIDSQEDLFLIQQGKHVFTVTVRDEKACRRIVTDQSFAPLAEMAAANFRKGSDRDILLFLSTDGGKGYTHLTKDMNGKTGNIYTVFLEETMPEKTNIVAVHAFNYYKQSDGFPGFENWFDVLVSTEKKIFRSHAAIDDGKENPSCTVRQFTYNSLTEGSWIIGKVAVANYHPKSKLRHFAVPVFENGVSRLILGWFNQNPVGGRPEFVTNDYSDTYPHNLNNFSDDKKFPRIGRLRGQIAMVHHIFDQLWKGGTLEIIVPTEEGFEHYFHGDWEEDSWGEKTVITSRNEKEPLICHNPKIHSFQDEVHVVARVGQKIKSFRAVVTDLRQKRVFEELPDFGQDVTCDPILIHKTNTVGEDRLVAVVVEAGKYLRYYWYDHRRNYWAPKN
ncbi:hypothetical protein [Candidatus Magnetaquicoccus inordinatus]|uniref:hypothetical protein n=1 Tax=Candidatus Magnetaquicoccus inordinatus TaxID=2496818 RepID=UPI00102D2693|nr:hypothetical protein [Candidatus Magnetaquicoccus inordinatus]